MTPRMESGELEQLFRRWAPVIFQRCSKLLSDPAAAEDATQEVFLKLMAHAQHLEPRDGYFGWIYRVATNHCLDLLRADARFVLGAPQDLAELAADLEAPPFAERELTVRLLLRFDRETQEVAVLSLVDGMTRDEVAEVLGLSRKTVGIKLQRFLVNARKYLQRTA